jgi:hypothetical protein
VAAEAVVHRAARPHRPRRRRRTPPAAPPPTVGADETFSSPGGTVVAHCDSGGNAFIVAWSPAQGFNVNEVDRGPAATTKVDFRGNGLRVRVTIQCAGTVPSAVISQEQDHSGPG